MNKLEKKGFIRIPIFGKEEIKENVFSRYKKPLSSLSNKKEFRSSISNFIDLLDQFGEVSVGEFIMRLKLDNDKRYLNFLNPYGDRTYSDFFINDESVFKRKGLYSFSNNNEIKYIGRCRTNYRDRINNGYGRIAPRNCYIGGQSTNCRINHLFTQERDQIEFFVLPMEDITKIETLEKKLIKEFNPPWNIQKS